MLKAERAQHILQRLDELYAEVEVPLDHQDPYTLLIAVLLSAQCTDERVNLITPKLWELADNPADMYQRTIEEIQAIVRPCGLAPAKAKNIHTLSGMLMDLHGGEVPETLEELEALPGVGHKTAQVVIAQAFDVPSFPVDTHIHRLAQRWKLSSGRNVATTERDLKKLFPIERWNKLHIQIILYGREYCSARGCNGMVCPLCVEMFPKRKSPVVTSKA